MTAELDAVTREGWREFFSVGMPRCGNCANVIDVCEDDLWRVLEAGRRDIECPYCEQPVSVG